MGISLLAIVFVFGVLVLIHELGHFLAAKWMGVRVERFSVGFPPRLFGKKIGDTDYCISAIPFGGYVKMAGMIDESLDTNLTGADYEFSSKPVWKRMIIISAGVIMNFLLAIVVLAVLNYVQGERIIPSTEIGRVGSNGIAQRIGFKTGDKIIAINNREVKNWEMILREYINNLDRNIDFTIQRDGQIIQLKYYKEWFKEKNAEYLDIGYMPSSRIGNVRPDMPAAAAGLQRGDEIVEIDGTPVHNWNEMTDLIRSHPADTISIAWLREGHRYSTLIVPVQVVEEDTSKKSQVVGKVGIEQYFELHEVSLFKAIGNGVNGTLSLLELNIRGLWWVLSGAKSAKEVLGGPIMIAKMAGEAAEVGWDALWTLIAALSAILAFFNILPIPALDGGHLLFLFIESIIGRPVSVKSRVLVQQVGIAILLTLIVFILYLDIKRLLF
jgi:regulator of sigma E protease